MKPKKKYSHKKTYNASGDKRCSKCKDYKHISCFGKNNASNDAHMYLCTECRKTGVKAKEVSRLPLLYRDVVSILDTPILKSQVLWQYQRPDYYDLCISKTI